MKILLSSFVVLTLAFASAAYEVRPDTKIVIPDMEKSGIVAALKDAAMELSLDIEEATGWKLAVVEASKAGNTQGAILIGEKFAAEAGLVPKDLKFFDNVIAEKNGRLYLFGHDKPCRKSTASLQWMQCILASVKAITDFEYQYMGVKRLMPGRTGTEVPKRKKISVPDGLYRLDRPVMENGTGRFFGMMYSIANNIFGYGTYRVFGGHTYNVALPPKKYLKTHPEFYGVIGGSVSRRVEEFPVLCISNPEVKRLLIEYILSAFDDGADVVELGQQDSHEFCECRRCKDYGGVNAKTAGEKYWIFHKSIAEELYKLRPEKTVQIISYMDTDSPPSTFKEFPPNVMIELTTYSESAFEAWSDYVVPRGFSVYVYMWGGYQGPGLTCKASVPVFARLARRFLKHNVRSIYRSGYGELFGCEGPASYVFNMLLANPNLDENVIFDEYVEAAYGPAANHMRKFHRAFDERVAAWAACYNSDRVWPWPRERTSMNTINAIYTPTMLELCESSLSAAEKTLGLSDKMKRRLKLVRREFDYTKLTAETCLLFNAYCISPSEPLFEAMASRVEKRRVLVESFFDKKGKAKAIEGWPEYHPLNANKKSVVMQNGRLFAPLYAPFNWNFERMRKTMPWGGKSRKSTDVLPVGKSAPWQSMGSMSMGKCDYETKFRCFYDAANFYVEVDAELPDSITFVPKGRDGECYRQECLELFIDPLFQKMRNFHFIWNPVENSCLEEAYGLSSNPLDPEGDEFKMDWNGKWDYKISRKNGRWRSVVKVPFDTLGVKTPRPGTKWYFNLGRETFKGDELQLQLWNPSMSGRGMRDLEAMGVVEFK